MLGVSQKVVIDSIKETTLLDKKATIAQGNISKQRDSLLLINRDQQKLIDSLRKESRGYRLEADSLRSAFNNLRFALSESKFQLDKYSEIIDLNDKLNDLEIKAIRRKRLGLGLSVGYGLNKDGLSPFVGVSLNYTVIRF